MPATFRFDKSEPDQVEGLQFGAVDSAASDSIGVEFEPVILS
jgi:hypothetical protein